MSFQLRALAQGERNGRIMLLTLPRAHSAFACHTALLSPCSSKAGPVVIQREPLMSMSVTVKSKVSLRPAAKCQSHDN